MTDTGGSILLLQNIPEVTDDEKILLDQELKKLMSELNPYNSMEMELTNLIGEQKVIQTELPLQHLMNFYKKRLEQPPKEVVISKKICQKLARLLFIRAGQVSSSITRPQLTPSARLSLEVIFYYCQKLPYFREVLLEMEAVELGHKMHLERHVNDSDPQHAKLAIEFILTMSNYPRFESWSAYTRTQSLRTSVDIVRAQQPPHEIEDNLPPEGQYYDTEVSVVSSVFRTSLENGLKEGEARTRLEQYGKNCLPVTPPPSPLKILANQVMDFMVIVLLVSAAVSAGLKEFISMGALLLVIGINVTIGFVQELKAEKALQLLNTFETPSATVIRNGSIEVISATDLVPGDIVELEEGNMVPADLRLFEARNLHVIEAILTGESEPIEKKTDPIFMSQLPVGDRLNMAFMSTGVVKGRGRGLVVRTGKKTEIGQISQALSRTTSKRTPLQKKLTWLGLYLTVIAFTLCGVVFGIGMARGYEVMEMVKVGISLAVSVIPEGLVTVVTVTFALGVKRMAANHALVRRLPAVETLGSVTVICSDKTGTLTEGKMKCNEIYSTTGQSFFLSGAGIIPAGDLFPMTSTGSVSQTPNSKAAEDLSSIFMICSLCNNSSISFDPECQQWKSRGDPTEVALQVAAEKFKKGKSYWTDSGMSFVSEIPFDSDRKRMTVVYLKSSSSSRLTMMKGAPEAIFSCCTSVMGEDGRMPINESVMSTLEDQSMMMATRGLRVLALAMKEESANTVVDESVMETDLCLIGLVGLIDPPREEVKKAIAKCNTAGIRVVMITGDHPTTAATIARQLGIIIQDDLSAVVMKGVELDALSKQDLLNIKPFPNVFARVSPANKLKIVQVLKMGGDIVAMTGDGVNDAPAIKNADVGIAMGITGTDLTKGSADIILLDDNFVTIVSAIKEGRQTYDNIRKFIIYLLTCNSAEIFLMVIAIAIGLPIPFTSIMILYANIFADVPPALALGIDPPESKVMKRYPRDPTANALSIWSSLLIIFNGLCMTGLSLLVYSLSYWVEGGYSEGRARSLVYAALTCTQLTHSFVSRSLVESTFRKDIFDNRWLVAAYVISMICLIGGLYLPEINHILELEELSGFDWLKVLAVVVSHVLIMEVEKFFLRLKIKYVQRSNKFFVDI